MYILQLNTLIFGLPLYLYLNLHVCSMHIKDSSPPPPPLPKIRYFHNLLSLFPLQACMKIF